MSLVQKVRSALDAHPRITTAAAVFGIGLAITAIVGSVIGMLDHIHMAQAEVRWYITNPGPEP
jgi:hypothetical protein